LHTVDQGYVSDHAYQKLKKMKRILLPDLLEYGLKDDMFKNIFYVWARKTVI